MTIFRQKGFGRMASRGSSNHAYQSFKKKQNMTQTNELQQD